jgi:hypothetical protein
LNFVWSSPPTIFEDSVTFLGLNFNLVEKNACLLSTTKETLARNAQTLTSRKTLREILSTIGLLLWTNWAIARCPLAFLENLLSWIRAASRGLNTARLNEHHTVPDTVRDDIAHLTEITSNAVVSVDDLNTEFDFPLSIFTDASDSAIACVVREGNTLSVRTVPTHATLTIFAREALAFLLAVESVPRGFISGCAVDNLNLLYALRKGHSKDPSVNAVLRAIYRRLDLSDLHLATGYVPSRLMLADFPSRGRPLPPNAHEFFDQPIELRPIPFFRVPRVEEEERGGVSTS